MKKKNIITICVILAILALSSLLVYKYMHNKPLDKSQLGEIEIAKEDEKEISENEKTLTIEDSLGNKYKKVSIINKGVMFDVPTTFEGEYDKENDVYYIYPKSTDVKNFGTLIALRFSDNPKFGKQTPEESKNKLMDRTKGRVKYKNHELKKPYNMTHLNRGKAKKMDDKLIYEEAISAKYSDPDNPIKLFDLATSFTYIPLINTNVEVTCICPYDVKKETDAVQGALVSSLGEYKQLPYHDRKVLDKDINTKFYSTKISSKYMDVTDVSIANATTGTLSKDIFDKDFGMFFTVGVTEPELGKDIDVSQANDKSVRYLYSSWFNFTAEPSTVLTIDDVKSSQAVVGGNNGYLHTFRLEATNIGNSSIDDIPNPTFATAYMVKLKNGRVGYVCVRHSAYNKELAGKIAANIAKNTKFH